MDRPLSSTRAPLGRCRWNGLKIDDRKEAGEAKTIGSAHWESEQ